MAFAGDEATVEMCDKLILLAVFSHQIGLLLIANYLFHHG
jgi:hypothetical protein